MIAFTLDVTRAEHERRISSDALESGAAEWRRGRRADYDTASTWLTTASTVIDTTELAAVDVADEIRRGVGAFTSSAG